MRCRMRHQVKAAFTDFDTDGDGIISASELAAVLRALGKDVSDEEAAELAEEHGEDGALTLAGACRGEIVACALRCDLMLCIAI
jgi:Ca2+-binding EF-hand superfamily protein